MSERKKICRAARRRVKVAVRKNSQKAPPRHDTVDKKSVDWPAKHRSVGDMFVFPCEGESLRSAIVRACDLHAQTYPHATEAEIKTVIARSARVLSLIGVIADADLNEWTYAKEVSTTTSPTRTPPTPASP